MHGTLYVGISRANAKSSLAARKLVSEYLDEERFAPIRDFGGKADYYHVGGGSSGYLSLLRLRGLDPKRFARFRKQYLKTKDLNSTVSLRPQLILESWHDFT